MPIPVADVLLGFVLPAVVAGGLLVLFAMVLPADFNRRYAPALALAGGFLPGIGLLALSPIAPVSHWHWLPYLLLMACFVGPVSIAPGASLPERAGLYAMISIIAAWLLVPDWSDLQPSRAIHIGVWAALACVLASLLEPLSKRTAPALLAGVLAATMLSAGVILVLSGNLRFAQMIGAGGGALTGIAISTRILPRIEALAGLAAAFAVLTGGALLVGRVNSFSSVPLAAYAIVPFAPLLLWPAAWGKRAELRGLKRTLVHAGLPLAACAAAVALAAVSELLPSG